MEGFTRLACGGCPPVADLLLALAAGVPRGGHRPPPTPASTSSPSRCSASPAGICDRRGRGSPTCSTPTPASTPTARASPACGSTRRSSPAPATRSCSPRSPAEVGRRAGLNVHVLSAPTGWYAGLGDGDRLWLVDATMDGSQGRPVEPAPPLRARARLRGAARALRALRARRRPPARRPRSVAAQPASAALARDRDHPRGRRARYGPSSSRSSTCANPAALSIRTTSPAVWT